MELALFYSSYFESVTVSDLLFLTYIGGHQSLSAKTLL